MLTVNGGHVYDKIEKISNALQRTNSETTSSDEWNAPKIQFKEERVSICDLCHAFAGLIRPRVKRCI